MRGAGRDSWIGRHFRLYLGGCHLASLYWGLVQAHSRGHYSTATGDVTIQMQLDQSRTKLAQKCSRPISAPSGLVSSLCHSYLKHKQNIWWARQDSNLQPDGYEPPALTIELRAPTGRTAGRAFITDKAALAKVTRRRCLTKVRWSKDVSRGARRVPATLSVRRRAAASGAGCACPARLWHQSRS